MCDDCARERAAREMADARIEELLTAVNRKHALAVKAEEAREAAIREHEEREEKLHETNERLALSLVDAESALAAEREAHAETREEINALTNERNAALELAEKRGAAYDMTWREVESLRERLDKEEEERGRQYGLRLEIADEFAGEVAFLRELLVAVIKTGTKDPLLDARLAEELRGYGSGSGYGSGYGYGGGS